MTAFKTIADLLGSSVDEAAALVSRYGDDVVDLKNARLSGAVRKAYELARKAGKFGKSFENENDALKALEELSAGRAYSGRITGNDLQGIPEFDDYFKTYKNTVIDPATNDLRKGTFGIRTESGHLQPRFEEVAPANEATARMLGVEPFRTNSVTGELIAAARTNDKKRFADAMAQRMSNHMALLSRIDLEASAIARKYGISPSVFYGAAGDLHGLVSQVTGIPRQMISSAMAVASAGSSPYDELLKVSAAVPYLRMGKNGVEFDDVAALADGIIKRSSKTGLYTSDPVYSAGKALKTVMNGADPLVDDISGLALKTYQYRNMMSVPDLSDISVSDRIAQRLSSGSLRGVSTTQGDIVAASPDWVADQGIAAAEGTIAAVPQEGSWFMQRVSELMKGADGKRSRPRVGQSYPFSADEVEALFTSKHIPGLEKLKPEDKMIGQAYKLAPGGRTIDPEAVAYAQQFENVGILDPNAPLSVRALAPKLRKPFATELTESGLALGRAVAPIMQSLRTPRSYALSLLAGPGTLAGSGLLPGHETQSPTANMDGYDPVAMLARRRAAQQIYGNGAMA